MRVGLFNPYLDTMGGGERYFLTAAEFFLRRGGSVDLFWQEETDLAKIYDRFGIDLAGVNFVPNIFNGGRDRWQRYLVTLKYDLIFFLSDGSLPLSFARKTIIHIQRPFTRASGGLWTKIKTKNKIFVCNSKFTKDCVDKTYNVDSLVIYPPVDVGNFIPGKKENIILGVGRFFAPQHPKKQEILIETFKKIYKKIPDWSLVLVGGTTLGTKVDDIINKSKGYPIKIITDATIERLKGYYGQAKLFWHAAGYGEDLEQYPERAEHFGITTVEAMAAGCVPVVFSGGGQKEIITGTCGFLWNDLKELEEVTQRLMQDHNLWIKVSRAAVLRSKDFSKERFFANLEKIV